MNIKKEYSRIFRANKLFTIKRKALLVLIAGLTITMVITFQIYRNGEKIRSEEFAAICNETEHKIAARLQAHALILRAGSAYFSVSDTVTRVGWKNFIEHSKSEKNLPGILGIGYSIIIPADHLNEHILSVRKEGFPEYTVYPDNPRSEYTSIIYLEPFSGRNLRAFGYDMFSEPVRRKAMELSRDNDVAMLSGRVDLVQETDEDIQFGTLMYIPFYKPGKPVNTVSQRREAILGWVYSPYRMNDLMQGILGHWEVNSQNKIRLEIFDDRISDNSLLFDSHSNSTEMQSQSISTLTLPIEFNGKKWMLFFTQSGEHAFYLGSQILMVFFGGIIISILLMLLSISYARIKASNLRFQTIFNESPLGIALIDSHSAYIYEVNPQFAIIAGRTMEEMLDIDWMQISHPDDVQEDLDNMALLNTGQISGFNMEKRYLKPDGTYVWINMTIAPVLIEKNDNASHLCMIEDISGRKHAEKELSDSENRFHSLFDNMVEGVALHELVFEGDVPVNYRIIDVNQQFIESIGVEREQVVGKLSTEAYGTLTPPYFDEYVKVSNSKTPLYFETWFEGMNKQFAISVAPWQENGFATIFFDITDRKKAEEALQESQRQLTTLIGNLLGMVYRCKNDPDWTMEFISEGCHSLTGYLAEEIIGNARISYNELIHSDDRQMVWDIIHDALEKKQPYQLPYRIITASGEEKWVLEQGQGIFGAEGKLVALEGYISNITELKRAEEALQHSLIFSESLLKTIPFGMNIVDETGTVLFQSEKFKEIFGEQAIGKKCWDLYKDDKTQCSDCPLTDGITIGKTATYESHGALGGRIFEISHTGMMYNGKKAMLEIFSDITERKTQEQELIIAKEQAEESEDKLKESNATKDKFFSIVAHDLKSPFNSILGFSDIIAERLKEKNYTDVEKYAEFIQLSSNKAMDLLSNLMEWSQTQTGRMEYNPEYFELMELIKGTELLLSGAIEQKSITLSKITPDTVAIFADKRMISAVLRNLISNAIKYTHPEGNITITVEEKQHEMLVSVSDNGVGISKVDREKLFKIDQTYSTSGTKNEKGTGLGLILCKEFVEKHDGKIWVESEVGKGSTFYFNLKR